MNLQTAPAGTSTRRQVKGRALVAACGLMLIAAAAIGFGVNQFARHSGSGARPAAQVETPAGAPLLVQANSVPAELSDLANLQASVLRSQPSSAPITEGSTASTLADLANLQASVLAAQLSAQPVLTSDQASSLSDLANLQAMMLAAQPSGIGASAGPIAVNSMPATLADLENLREQSLGSTPALSPAIRSELSDLDNLQQSVLHQAR